MTGRSYDNTFIYQEYFEETCYITNTKRSKPCVVPRKYPPKIKRKKSAKFLVSEQEVAMPTTTETHHSGEILPFFSFSFFTPLNFNKKLIELLKMKIGLFFIF
jgi:hypothetical protein